MRMQKIRQNATSLDKIHTLFTKYFSPCLTESDNGITGSKYRISSRKSTEN